MVSRKSTLSNFVRVLLSSPLVQVLSLSVSSMKAMSVSLRLLQSWCTDADMLSFPSPFVFGSQLFRVGELEVGSKEYFLSLILHANWEWSGCWRTMGGCAINLELFEKERARARGSGGRR